MSESPWNRDKLTEKDLKENEQLCKICDGKGYEYKPGGFLPHGPFRLCFNCNGTGKTLIKITLKVDNSLRYNTTKKENKCD